jgi:phosphocarrier protein HPr
MAQSLKFTVADPVGLYATPATELVNTVKQFYCHVTLIFEGKEVNLKSMMGVLSLGIPTHAELEIITEGEDEKRAIDLIKDKLNELGIAHIE